MTPHPIDAVDGHVAQEVRIDPIVPPENPIRLSLRRHPALVPMMQPADFGNGDDHAAIGLNRWWFRWVLPQREVRARLVVIRDVAADDPQQMTVVKRNHVVQAFPRSEPINRSA